MSEIVDKELVIDFKGTFVIKWTLRDKSESWDTPALRLQNLGH